MIRIMLIQYRERVRKPNIRRTITHTCTCACVVRIPFIVLLNCRYLYIYIYVYFDINIRILHIHYRIKKRLYKHCAGTITEISRDDWAITGNQWSCAIRA